jgi:adenylate cyclase
MKPRIGLGRSIRFEGQRDYPLTIGEAWRLLADTDHMNRALGFPPVDVSPSADAGGSFARQARARFWGVVPVRWKEYPFDWVHEHRWAVRREFEGGPFREVEIAAEIEPLAGAARSGKERAGDGVRVKVAFSFLPAGLTGRLLARRVGPRSVESILRYCDDYVARRSTENAGELPATRARPEVDRERLERGLERLVRAPVRSELLPRLRRRIVEGTDEQVLRVRPYEVADVWTVDRLEVLRLFLHATRAGLFDLRWELMCPACRVPKGEVDSLGALPDRFHCETCGIDYETDFDRRVELRFSVSPALRAARDDTYCVGSPMRTPHVLAQLLVVPGETRELTLTTPEPLWLRALGGMQTLALLPATGPATTFESRATAVPASPAPAERRIRLAHERGMWAIADGPEGASEQPLLEGVRFLAGRDVLALTNRTPEPLVAVLERDAWTAQAATAAEVTSLQEFRDLFSSEVLAPRQEVGVSHMALLFTDLKGSTSLYEGIGDAPAYGRVNRHFDFLKEKIALHRGAIVKTIGDAVMGAFVRMEDALAAALEIQAGMEEWCRERGIDPPLVLKAGLHHGPVIAVNANERLDYFGRTVNIAARLGAESGGGEVILMREAFEEPVVRAALEGWLLHMERFNARLRGIESEQELVRLRPVGPG